jgi:TusA-related sulfurtransferase
MNMTADKEINVVGKACPIPIITLAKQVRHMQKGQTVRITGNDPIFEPTVVEFCREWGHQVLETTREGRTVSIFFVIQSGAQAA